MWELTVPWWEIVLRSFLLSLFILILLRLTNRGGGEISGTDLVVLFTLGNLAASAAMKSDDSLTAAIISMSTFVATSTVINFLSYRIKFVDHVLEGDPKVLIHNGKVNQKTLAEEQLSHEDVMRAIRESGCLSIARVHVAMVETNGKISVIARPDQ